MLILPAEADESVVGTAVERIAGVVSRAGGQVGKIDRWGRKRLAYELEGRTEGYYAVVDFTADPDAIGELDRALQLADEVVRFKVTLRPEAA
jgi:small subunit ribosomal protein S6